MKRQLPWRRAIAAALPSQRQFDQMARALNKTVDVKEVKEIRDWADAARKFAGSTGLDPEFKRQGAELTLRAERRAGELLAKLALRGGDHKSSSRCERVTLASLGVNQQASARWQLQAAVPEAIFKRYIAAAKRARHDITAQGLLRLQKSLARRTGKASRLSNAVLLTLSNGTASRRNGPRRLTS
jgi:hypothetical protein